MNPPVLQPIAPSYNALGVANELLKIAREHRSSLTPEQLMLMTYCACGWYVAIFGVPLVDEKVWATHSGPLIESLDEEFGHYGKGPILELAKYRKGPAVPLPISLPMMDTTIRDFLKTVWDTHSRFSMSQLRSLVVTDSGPWYASRIGIEAGHRVIIHPDVLRRYFYHIAANYRRQQNS
jgi:uncharacterized phage-associated protein